MDMNSLPNLFNCKNILMSYWKHLHKKSTYVLVGLGPIMYKTL